MRRNLDVFALIVSDPWHKPGLRDPETLHDFLKVFLPHLGCLSRAIRCLEPAAVPVTTRGVQVLWWESDAHVASTS